MTKEVKTMQGSDVALLQQIVKAIADKPEDVVIERKVDEMGVLLVVRLDNQDAGALIGKGGSTIAAIRRIMKLVGVKSNARINVKLDVPPKGKKNDYDKSSTEDQSNSSGKL
jgi:predicted RNA-binding protein YlqC (UPF0109 family)